MSTTAGGNIGKPLRAALIGSGAWAKVLARAGIGASRFAWAGCWGRSPDKVHALCSETGLTPIGSLDAIWKDTSIEAVVIALPNERHRRFAEDAARQGKHVFIEKPIAETLADGLAVAALEATHGVRVGVGHCARLLAGNRYMRDAIGRGDIGRVTMIETRFANARGLSLTPDDWRWYRAHAPGGPLGQIAIHQFDTLRALGGDLRTVAAISARLSPSGAEVEDQWLAAVRFESGALGHVASSWTSAGDHSIRVSGTKATLHYTVDQTRWSDASRLHEGALLTRQASGVGPHAAQQLDVAPGDMFREELNHFADGVRGACEFELSAWNGCLALAAVHAALSSAERGGESVAIAEVLEAARRSPNAARSHNATLAQVDA